MNLLPGRYAVTTDPLRTERRIELAVLALLLLLGLQLLYSGARFALVSMPEAVNPAADALAVREVSQAPRVTTSQSEEILARPLFWEGRRPVEDILPPADTDESAAPGQMKGVALLGVFGVGDSAGIIVRIKDNKRRVMVGEEINGWELQSVQPKSVVFAADGRTRELKLRHGRLVVQQPPANKGEPGTQASAKAVPANESSEDQLSLGGAPGR